jgi:toxin CcdB
MAQYDLYRMPEGGLIVVLQSDLLDEFRTRVVAPLVPAPSVERAVRTLNPTVVLGETTYLVMPQLAATLTLSEMGDKVGSLAVMQDVIVRAVDALLSGI